MYVFQLLTNMMKLDVCETIYWSGESWSVDTNDIYDVTDYLYTICDNLEDIEVSTQEWAILNKLIFQTI